MLGGPFVGSVELDDDVRNLHDLCGEGLMVGEIPSNVGT